MSINTIRAAFAHCAFTGLSRNHLGLLLTDLLPAWTAAREDRLHARRTRTRIRKPGAGRRPRLSFTDRVVITLVHLRLAIPHAALAVAYGVDRATVTRAVTQIRPLLARRGFATPAGTRLHTLADVFAYAAAEGVTLRIDATEIRVRRPRQGRPGRKAFVSGKLKQNTIKTTLAADHHGAILWCGATRPGRMHDVTTARVEGVDALLDAYPSVKVLVDAGYQGLARDHHDQVSAPPLKLRPGAPTEQQAAWEHDRKRQSSQRIAVEHAIAELKWWRVLQRFTGRRELLPETINAIAGLVSDRSAGLTW
ncbi:transposase family protein [Krasilnikovia sp. MM14-A1259]|uniref:transposase family protein n=1 Tax=Krasilnikovia sp. MM14-A1259 TaxID=3373539 RepID=UPI00399C6949